MLINISLMKGEIPRLKSHLLPDEAATFARDCRFDNGIISPIKGDLQCGNITEHSPKTLFKYDRHWLSFEDAVSVINNPMAKDQWQRVYWTGQGKPKVTSQDIAIGFNKPNAWYDLGVPRPSRAPIIKYVNDNAGQPPPEGEPESFDDENRTYIQTYVTRFGEEGPPGEPSDIKLIERPGASVTVSLAQPSKNTHNITHTRLYRSVTSHGDGDYMLVCELPISRPEYVDDATYLNAPVLETWDYDPPDADMQGLCNMANGICAGFAGNAVMFSEAYLPYAWPLAYRGSTEHEIVAITAIGTSLVVVTKGYPYIFSGVTPASVNGMKLEVEQACVSGKSLVVVNGAALYASPDGIVSVSQNGAQLLTEPLITRDQWQEMNLSSIRAWAVEGKYVALHDKGGFVFDPISQSFTQISDRWDCACNDLERDMLIIARGNQLYAWQDSINVKSFTWRSKTFLVPVDSLFSSARIQANEPDKIGVTFFADDEPVFTVPTGELDDQPFRLPSVRAKKWAVEITGTAEVERILLASSMQELA